MKTRSNWSVLLGAMFAVLAGTVVVAPGCGSGVSSICDAICDCEGCSDDEYDDCIDNLEDGQREADNEGCTDQYDEYLSCLEDEVECRSGDVDADGCGSFFEDLRECLK